MDASVPPSLPGIQESQAENKTTAGAAKLASKQMTLDVTKSTPRIDISRASSSSQHEDSRDSSPENVFDQVHYNYGTSLVSKSSLITTQEFKVETN